MSENDSVDPTGGPIENMACAVCGHVVMTHAEAINGVELRRTWTHTLTADDHPVVPVPVAEIRTNFRCDFCMADHSRWLLPVNSFKMIEDGREHYSSETDWAACDVCADALRINDWQKLVYRAAKTHKDRGGPIRDKNVWVNMYAMLRPHITGPVRLREEATDSHG